MGRRAEQRLLQSQHVLSKLLVKKKATAAAAAALELGPT